MNTTLPLCSDFFPVPSPIPVSPDSAAEGKAPLSAGGVGLFSFVVSGLATLLVCALAPVRAVALPKDLQGSGKTRGQPPPANEVRFDTGRE
jgi:hypothetical protein